MTNWRTWRLSEVTASYDSLRVPVKEADREPGVFPYYGASGVVDHISEYIFDGEYLLVSEDGENLRTRKTPIAFLATGKFWVNNHAHIIKGNERAVTHYLAYYIEASDISGYLSGSTMPKLTQGRLASIEVNLPDFQYQEKVVAILSAFDDKIELNRQMNRTLEQMARALFKSWFVDFDPVRAKMRGEMPEGMDEETAVLFPDELVEVEGWEVPRGWMWRTIGDIAEVIDCLHAKKPNRVIEGKPYIQLNNISDHGKMDLSDIYRISDSDYAKWVSRIEVTEGDCIITNVGRVGAVCRIPAGFRGAIGRNITAIRLKNEFAAYPTYLIELLISDWMKNEIVNKTDAGTILNALNVKNIPKLKLIQASKGVLERFEILSHDLRLRTEQNLRESAQLAQLRDALLPRLLSGEVDVGGWEVALDQPSVTSTDRYTDRNAVLL